MNIAYCRKSTESEDRQVQSIDDQQAVLLRLAERDGVAIAKIFTESKSAKSSGRPVFNEMLRYIRKHGTAVLYVWKPDRIARNMADGGLIIELMDQGSLKEIRTPEKMFRKTADDLFMLGLDFGISKKYIDDMSSTVRRGIVSKLQKGVWHNTAPIGYLNDKANKTITLDPAASPFIKIIFDRYASGAYNLRTLTKAMYNDGFRTKAGKKVDKSGIQRILRNPFYYGVMLSKGISYQGKHTPLISKELFEQANDILSGKQKSKRQKHVFPLGGLMKCANCGCAMTAYRARGKYLYYVCTNFKGGCGERKHLKSEEVTVLVSDLFRDKLRVDEKLLDIALRAEEKMYGNEVNEKKFTRQKLKKQLDEIMASQDDLALKKGVPEDVFARTMASLKRNQVDCELQLSQLDSQQAGDEITLEQVKNVFLQANSIAKAFAVADSSLQREYAETIVSNIGIKNKKVAYSLFKPAYQRIADITDKRDLQELHGGRV